MNIANQHFGALAFVFTALVFVGLSGCGSGNTPENAIADSNKTNIQRLANLYSLFQIQNKLRGPTDEAEFKMFIRNVDAKALGPMGIDTSNLDELFTSEDDGEPFVIRYGVDSGPRGSKQPVIFEKTGSGGKRSVAFLNMVQRDVDDQEYEELLSNGLQKEEQSNL